jgi:hypothetical protein
LAAQADGPRSVDDLLEALGAYRAARTVILDVLGIPSSNRDPLAEFSERIVAALLGGVLAPNRVQTGYDITLTDGRTVQVKYLANPGGPWVNEHHIRSLAGVDHYAVVIYEAFKLKAVLVFPADLTDVCARLGKRHPRQESELQLTRRNYEAICKDLDTYEQYGVQVFTFGGVLEGQGLTRAIVAAAKTADSYDALARGVRAFGDVSDAELRKRVHSIAEGSRELSDHPLRDVFVHRSDDEWVRPLKDGLFNEP